MSGQEHVATHPTAERYVAARQRLLGAGAGPGAVQRADLARLTDEWLSVLFGQQPPGIALVAVGGYGRGELSPRSDLDLLLLHDGCSPRAEIAALADRIWYPVWDAGLALDHSVRTPDEVRAAAQRDLRVQLGLLDARHLAGDGALTADLRTGTLGRWRAQAPARLPQLRELVAERGARHGELRFLLEPDLKEARGGLRDVTALRAVAASWLADPPRAGLDEARAALLDVRDALHLTTGRATDRLTGEEQVHVARALGVPDADALLRQVYGTARTLSDASDVTWREVSRVLRERTQRTRERGLLGGGRGAAAVQQRMPLADGVVAHGGEAVLARAARPERDPVLVLRAAAAAARAGLPLAPSALRRLASGGAPLPVPWPAAARQEFVTLLGAGEATVPVWEALESAGLIEQLLPGWERVRCLPQRNPVHRWTVDRHLLETAVQAAAFTRRVHRPDLLLVAALLHDIGKGRPGDHAAAGSTVTRDLAARMGFGARDVEVLAGLVQHHLLLCGTATGRDLDDPATVRSVADRAGSVESLELLHALTEADARATGPGAWSSWRSTLVSELTGRVRAVLEGENLGERRADRMPSASETELARQASRSGGPVLTLCPQPAEQLEPGQHGRPGDGTGPVGAELLLALPEQTGVLPCVAGVLALHRLAVRSAALRVLTPRGSDVPVLLLTWRVAAEYGALPQASRLRADVVRALDGSLGLVPRLAEREAAYRRTPRGRAQPPPPQVRVEPAGSRDATVLEVRAPDAPGLLYRLGSALEAARVRVRSAHIDTLGGDAVDTFYVTGADNAALPPVDAAALAWRLERELRGEPAR